MADKTPKQLTTELTTLSADDWLVAQRDSDNVVGKARYSTVFGGGWNPLGVAPDTVTANGNKSYSLVFNSNDLTDTLTPGMRLRTTRTATAPTQSTSLNGTTQYYSKTSPSGMTFTDDFSVSAWVKLSEYDSTRSVIASRFNNTSGWWLIVNNTGQIELCGFNASGSNFSRIVSYQSILLNKWVHISAQLDMSAFTATPTTSYVMLDGVDVPASVSRGGTNPTALIQAGNLEIGSFNGGTDPFTGKIAQVAVYSAKVLQATHLAAMNQGLAGTETSLISAYSFDGVITDLASTGNDLTANGSAVATNNDSPFGNSGVSTTLDYGIVMAAAFSTNTTLTVQVPEGCTIPSSGGVTTVDYSTQNVPYGFPRNSAKWVLSVPIIAILSTSGTSTSTTYNPGGVNIKVPVGAWLLGYQMQSEVTTSASVVDVYSGLSTSASDMSLLPYLVSRMTMNLASGTGATLWNNNKESDVSVSSQTPYYAVIRSTAAFSTAQIRGSTPTATGTESTVLYAKNAYI